MTRSEQEISLQRSEINKKEIFQSVLEQISGEQIERHIIELAKIGGERISGMPEQPERYTVSRLALSQEDFAARELLASQMQDAGMEITRSHPLGVVGFYPGTDSLLSPVVMMSHFDSVPRGGMYDGTVGVLSAIEVVRSFHTTGLQLRRPIAVLALTGEESSRFNMALFGSRGVFHGLTSDELASKREGDISIREALEAAGYAPDNVRHPIFTNHNAHAVMELHVDQTGYLEKQQKDLGVVEAIAAPDRREIIIGDPLQPENSFSNHSRFLALHVSGKTGHSGATPMGKIHRADGLVVTSEFLSYVGVLQGRYKKSGKDVKISVGSVNIHDQALNKIPGITQSIFRISGSEENEIMDVIHDLQAFATRRRKQYERQPTRFDEPPLTLDEIVDDSYIDAFYSGEKMLKNHALAGRIITNVHSVCNLKMFKDNHIVGTIGTYSINDRGQIVLGIDIRGVNLSLRTAAVEKVVSNIQKIATQLNVQCAMKQLPGSEDPVEMSPELADISESVIDDYAIGSHIRTFSAAGHDTLHAAKAGIPSIMLFIPSERGGVAHTPEEYTSRDSLQKGARALAALVYELADEI